MAIAQNYPNIVPSLSLDFANVKALDPRITFTRASTATYYGTETAKAEENLLTFSQELDSAIWNKINTSVAANTTVAPDGTTTADTLTATAGNAVHQCFGISSGNAVIGLTYTQSIFVKKGTLDFLQLTPGSAPADMLANFNLTTGAIALTGAGLIGATTSTIGDFFRFTITFVSNSTGNNLLGVNMVDSGAATRSQAFNAVGTETVILWGGQHEQRASVTAYTPTTTQPITNFIPVLESAASGVARFDHNPTTFESLGLLIEEQRTNLLLRSEEFDNASWGKNGVTVSADTAVAPNGVQAADSIIATTANAAHFLLSGSIAFTSGTAYTQSVYAKALGTAGYRLRLRFNAAAFTSILVADFDLNAGTVAGTTSGSITATITPVGNGWYRCTATATATATASSDIYWMILSSNGLQTHTGDGFSGALLWGAQLEAGAFAASYIPTTASQVTRAADAASMTGANFSSWYRQDEGTLYAEHAGWRGSSFPALVSINNGGGESFMRIIRNAASGSATAQIRMDGQANNVASYQLLVNTSVLSNKISFTYATNSFAGVVDGGTVSADTSGNVPNVTQMNIGSNYGIEVMTGHIRKLSYYPVRVTNAQLTALTS